FPTDLDGAHIPSSIGWKDRPRRLHGWVRGRVPLEGRTEPGVLLSFELQDVREPPRYQLRCARLFQGLSGVAVAMERPSTPCPSATVAIIRSVTSSRVSNGPPSASSRL